MTDSMFMNSNSSNESYSDNEKCRLQTVDLICSDNKEEQLTTKISSIRNLLTNNQIEYDTSPFWQSNDDNDENSRLEKTG
jgi:hypothetical protein